MKKCIALFAVYIETIKTLKYHTFLKKHKSFLLFAVSAREMMKKCLKKKNRLRY